MQLTERTVGDVTLFDLGGRLILDDGLEPLRLAVDQAIAEGRHKLLLNFSGVTYLDSAGVGLIAFKYATLCRNNGQMKLCNLGPRVYRVLETTKLLTVFQPFTSEADALKGFTG